MWNPFTRKEKPIDVEIDRVLSLMAKMPPGSKEYGFALEDLRTLHETKNIKSSGFQVSGDTVVMCLMGIVQMLMVINHEEIGHIISTKSLGFVNKGKV
jgi:hypothetical protein